jgi:RNA polymerase sigma-70 factor, ECF subfamily
VAAEAHSAGRHADDADILAALRAGDEAAFAQLVDRWSPGMLRLARLHVSTQASAEEVVQEAWLAALRGLDRFEGRSHLRTWVFRIVSNLAKTTGVREARTTPFSAVDTGPTVDPARFRGADDPYPGGWRQFPATWPQGPEATVLASEALDVVRDGLEGLPARQRAVMALRDIDGFAAEEVCELLELSPGNQRVLLHRARAGVRVHLERYFDERRTAR